MITKQKKIMKIFNDNKKIINIIKIQKKNLNYYHSKSNIFYIYFNYYEYNYFDKINFYKFSLVVMKNNIFYTLFYFKKDI